MIRRIRTDNTDTKPDFLLNKVKNASGTAFSTGTNGDGSKYVSIDFNTSSGLNVGSSSVGSSGIEIGNSTNSGTLAFIDFHYGIGSSQDFNVRFLNNGNESYLVSTPSKNIFNFDNGNFAFNVNSIPATDGTLTSGSAGNKWASVWSSTGTIQTSDKNFKEQIQETSLGLDFILKLKPVSWKWKDEPQKEIKNKVYKKIYDKNGIFKDFEVTEKTEIIPEKKYKRKHYGFINQDIEDLLESEKINTNDFAGFILDEETKTRALRYDQFIAPMIKAIQEQQKQIDELKSQVKKLENKK